MKALNFNLEIKENVKTGCSVLAKPIWRSYIVSHIANKILLMLRYWKIYTEKRNKSSSFITARIVHV